jgi:hypothetical protein
VHGRAEEHLSHPLWTHLRVVRIKKSLLRRPPFSSDEQTEFAIPEHLIIPQLSIIIAPSHHFCSHTLLVVASHPMAFFCRAAIRLRSKACMDSLAAAATPRRPMECPICRERVERVVATFDA